MKKIALLIFLAVILSTGSAYAVGNLIQAHEDNLIQRENHIASKEAVITQHQEKITQNLQQRAQIEITRRLNFLNELITKINSLKKLSSAEKSDLVIQIQAQIDGLNALQAKIKADTDNVTLKADVQSIVKDYYIFLFFRVKINLLISADRLSTITDNLNQIYAKLQTRINQAKADGTDVTNLNALLSDMQAKITDAQTQYQAVQTELTPLTAQGYPGNKSILQDARTKLQTARKDLGAAYQDAIQIRHDLVGMKIKNPQASSSAH